MKPYRPHRGSRRLLLTAGILALLPFTTASAAAPRLPASLYPTGAHITYRPTLSNHQMDCLWSFFCEGHLSLFHSRAQDDFDRTGGWGQFAGLRRQGRMEMAFELFASQYAPGVDETGNPWAATSYADLSVVLRSHDYHPLHGAPALLPRHASGRWMAELQRNGDADLVVMAAWTGQRDTEAIVMFDHGSPTARATAISMLAAQVRRSLSIS